MPEERPSLLICVSCWRGGVAPPGFESMETDGRKLYERTKALAESMGDAMPARVVPNLCFANCERGCSAGIAAPGKWSYLMGDLGPEHAEDLLAYAATYGSAKAGVVLPSKRPASLEKTVIARFPAAPADMKDAAE